MDSLEHDAFHGFVLLTSKEKFISAPVAMLIRILIVGLSLVPIEAISDAGKAAGSTDCGIERVGDLLTLSNRYFRWTIDISEGPKAVQCENLLTGTRIDLHGGEEAALRFSGARFGSIWEKGQDISGHQRLELVDWRQTAGGGARRRPRPGKGIR